MSTCPSCSTTVDDRERFCEACGATLSPDGDTAATADPTAAASPDTVEAAAEAPVEAAVCASCGGRVAADGYCETCGTKAVSERDHYTEQPASWVAACCDRGIRHHRNEDATAIAANPAAGSRAVLVVCDGVSTSLDSDVASLAGARAARDLLVAQQPAGLGVPASRAAATTSALEAATARANAAVIEHTAPESDNSASCTFAAAYPSDSLSSWTAWPRALGTTSFA